MIDALPLDLFGDDEPQSTAPPATIACQWCGAQAPAGTERCPTCDARLVTTPPAEVDHPPAERCQWCGASVAAEDDTCPACGWDARGESQIEMPGITVPFSETQVRSLYGGTTDSDQDAADAVGLAVNIVNLLLRG